jgi:hypothetical protein
MLVNVLFPAPLVTTEKVLPEVTHNRLNGSIMIVRHPLVTLSTYYPHLARRVVPFEET